MTIINGALAPRFRVKCTWTSYPDKKHYFCSMIWIELTNLTELETLLDEEIAPKHYLIFKNSTRCGTSRMALKQFEKRWNEIMPAYLVNVVENREVSDAITGFFEIRHESPQILLIRNGECVFNASHSMIEAEDILRLAGSENF